MRYLTSGESHGQSLNAIIEGFPSGVKIDEEKINLQLAKRQSGYGRGGRMKIETDKVKILSGVRFGITTGAPVCLEIKNKDWENWTIPMSTSAIDDEQKNIAEEKTITALRPGHADLAGAVKYNHQDIRNILERSSARETATRVAVGAFSRILLENFGIEIFSHVTQIGTEKAKNTPRDYKELQKKADSSELRCADESAEEKMETLIDKAKQDGDSLGGYFEVIITNPPIGLGSFVHWDRKLDGLFAQAVMSIPAIKSVEIGVGIKASELSGSKMHDEILPGLKHSTNNAGGIEGGMTNGEPIIIKAAMKAIPTMTNPLKSIDLKTGQEHKAHVERADVCAVPACAIVAEAMAANVLANVFLEKFGGDSISEITQNYQNYIGQNK
ncbi:MAG: chorismate synthase [Candidatus Gastranaerophilales bacterium]|nr:chorismate synthase [Candidatus Gastranaerophilales bacterium]